MQIGIVDLNMVFGQAKQLKKNKTEIIGEKPIMNGTGTILGNIATEKAAFNEN